MGQYIRLKNVVLSYNHLFQKHAPPGTTNAKYSAEFLLDPAKNSEDASALHALFQQTATEAGKGSQLQYLKSPLRLGDELNAEAMSKGRNPRAELEGMYVVRASDATTAPAVVTAAMQPISETNKSQIFSGCVVNAFIDVYWSNNQANPGVYCGLKGVQLVDNTNVTRISGAGDRAPEQMFEAIPGAPVALQPVPANAGPVPQERAPAPVHEELPW